MEFSWKRCILRKIFAELKNLNILGENRQGGHSRLMGGGEKKEQERVVEWGGNNPER